MVRGPRKSLQSKTVFRLSAEGSSGPNQVTSREQHSKPMEQHSEGQGTAGGSRAHSWHLENKGRGVQKGAGATDDTGPGRPVTGFWAFILKTMEVSQGS